MIRRKKLNVSRPDEANAVTTAMAGDIGAEGRVTTGPELSVYDNHSS